MARLHCRYARNVKYFLDDEESKLSDGGAGANMMLPSSTPSELSDAIIESITAGAKP